MKLFISYMQILYLTQTIMWFVILLCLINAKRISKVGEGQVPIQ
jgi:hypothetical protein